MSLAEKLKKKVAETVLDDQIEEMRANFRQLLEEVRKMNRTLEEIKRLLEGRR